MTGIGLGLVNARDTQEGNSGNFEPINSSQSPKNGDMARDTDLDICPWCMTAMVGGIAYHPVYGGSEDLGGVCTMNEVGARLGPCLKCPECGFSTTVGKGVSDHIVGPNKMVAGQADLPPPRRAGLVGLGTG